MANGKAGSTDKTAGHKLVDHSAAGEVLGGGAQRPFDAQPIGQSEFECVHWRG